MGDTPCSGVYYMGYTCVCVNSYKDVLRTNEALQGTVLDEIEGYVYVTVYTRLCMCNCIRDCVYANVYT